MPALYGAPSGNVYVAEDDGLWHHIPDPDTFNALGYDWNSITWYGSEPPDNEIGDPVPEGGGGGGTPSPDAGAPVGTLYGLPNKDVYVSDGAVWHHIPDSATFAALGYQWADVQWVASLPGPIGSELPTVTTPPPPGPPPVAQTIQWGGRTWSPDQLPQFIAYLAAHGTDFSTWAANHPAAALVMTGPPVDPSREALPKSVGEALLAYIQAGSTAAQAASQVAALVAALNAQGLTNISPAQLLADAQAIVDTLTSEGDPPPVVLPPTETEPPPGGGSGGPPTAKTQFSHAELETLWVNGQGPPAVKDLAAAIMQAESQGDSTAIDNTAYPSKPGYHSPPKGATVEYSVGLSQINVYVHTQYSEAEMLVPENNISAMRVLSKGGTDFTPWSTFTNGAYVQYLQETPSEGPPGPPTPTPSGPPPAVTAGWRNLVDFYKTTGPQTANQLSSVVDSIMEVIR